MLFQSKQRWSPLELLQLHGLYPVLICAVKPVSSWWIHAVYTEGWVAKKKRHPFMRLCIVSEINLIHKKKKMARNYLEQLLRDNNWKIISWKQVDNILVVYVWNFFFKEWDLKIKKILFLFNPNSCISLVKKIKIEIGTRFFKLVCSCFTIVTQFPHKPSPTKLPKISTTPNQNPNSQAFFLDQ
jgi:hypothetical protein